MRRDCQRQTSDRRHAPRLGPSSLPPSFEDAHPPLRNIGIEDSAQIAGINGGLACFNWLMAIGGALLVERVGRRPLWLISTVGMLVTWIVFTALSGVFSSSGSGAVGAATVAFIFLYNGFYDIAWTPLSYSYTSEVLPTSLRASGMAIFSLGQAGRGAVAKKRR